MITNLRQKVPVIEHIQSFQKLRLKVDSIPDDKLLDIFIRILKDNIKHEVCLFEPTSLDKALMMARKVESKNMAMLTRRNTTNIYRDNNVPSSNPPQPTRLKPQQMDERRETCLYYDCDNKYSKGHNLVSGIILHIL